MSVAVTWLAVVRLAASLSARCYERSKASALQTPNFLWCDHERVEAIKAVAILQLGFVCVSRAATAEHARRLAAVAEFCERCDWAVCLCVDSRDNVKRDADSGLPR